MKKIVIYLLLLPALLASCAKETVDEGAIKNKDVVFHITLGDDASSTRALTDDKAISDFYLFAFELIDGEYVYAYTPRINSWTTEKINLTARSSENKQLLLAVANAWTEASRVIPQYGETLEAISRRLEIVLADKWPAEGTNRQIPMCTIAEGLTITEDTKSLGSTASPYYLVRMLARFDITLAPAVTGEWTMPEVFLYRPRESGWLVYNNTDTYWDADAVPPHAKKAHARTVTDFLEHGDDKYRYTTSEESKTALTNTIYSFETLATGERLKTTAIVVGLKKSGETDLRYYRIDVKKDTYGNPVALYEADVVRNHIYDITIASVTGEGEEDEDTAYAGRDTGLEIFMEVAAWSTAAINVPIRETKLNLANYSASVNEHTTARFYFWSNQLTENIALLAKGIKTDQTQFTVADFFDTNLVYNQTTGDGYLDLTIKDAVIGNLSLLPAKDYFLDIKAGDVIRRIKLTVTNNRSIPGGLNRQYIGTFHAYNQTGERLIANSNSGEWTAKVEDPQGQGRFVKLAAGKTIASGVWEDLAGIDPGSPEQHQVEGDAKEVSGTGNIFFRVGLTDKIDSEETRYARIAVTTAGMTYYIYVRQGSAADYVYGPDDGRSNTIRFSPYNLTAKEYVHGTLSGGAEISDHAQIPKKSDSSRWGGGMFVQYPTQLGAHFLAMPYQYRYAYHIINPGYFIWITGYNDNGPSGVWDSYAEEMESCPKGYRRPNDGSTSAYVGNNTDGLVAQCEIRQSLFAVPPSGNSAMQDPSNIVVGYYADGYFDRREITVRSASGYSSANETLTGFTSVSGYSAGIAMRGFLYFNPANHRSLFLPCGGYRDIPYAFYGGGLEGNYLTSSRPDDTSTWVFGFEIESAYHSSIQFYKASQNSAPMSIRCVKDE